MKLKLQLFILLTCASFTSFCIPNKILPKSGKGPWVVNVYYENIEQLRKYVKIQEPWKIDRKEKFFMVSVEDIYQYQELFSYGFNVEINQRQMELKKQNELRIQQELRNNPNSINSKSIPSYSCLRTVEETYATIDNLVANYPTLASNEKIGESWEKQHTGGQSNGYDLRVIKITNSAIAGPKPILYVTSSMHAREMAPAELNTRFAEYLLNNYGTDADATWIVDYREVHLLLQANPDGRKRAEGVDTSKRKNQNNFHNSGQNRRGVDMNRNFVWMWDQGTGSSGVASSQSYRGPSAQSELENQAIDTHLKSLFIDARGPNLNDAAADDTTGVYIDLHSEIGQVLWPYGFDDPGQIPLAPNDAQLRTFGRKLAWYNGYLPQASNELYGADGAADDNAYGQLGVAAFTFELDGDAQVFRPTCSYVDNTIVPDNIQALTYAAKVAKTPYITASGPDVENLTLNSTEVNAGTSVTINGVASDLHFNNNNGTESTQNILKVEAFLDVFPDEIGATAIQLTAVDGSFNSRSENFAGQIDTTGMLEGQHIIYLVATDTNNISGAPYAIFFNIADSNNFGTLTGYVRGADTNQFLSNVNINLGSQQLTTNTQGQYSTSITAGNYSLTASKQGYETITVNNISVSPMQTTTQNIYMQAICASLDDSVDSYNSIANAVTSGWSHAAADGIDDWTIDLSSGTNSSRAFKTKDVGATEDKFLISPLISATEDSLLEFWHKFDFEVSNSGRFYDGGVLEASIDNGLNWFDLKSKINIGSYNQTLETGSNPIGGQEAWAGRQSEYTKVEVDLSSYAGSDISVRWRLGSDESVGAGNWLIDDIKVLDSNFCPVSLDIIFENGFEN